MRLSEFTPAETLLLTKGSRVLLKDLLKYTFMDLLLKKVLVSTKKLYQPDPRSKAIMMTYISTGPSFNSYTPLLHEQVFTAPFEKGKRNIQFKFMVKIAYEKASSYSDYDPVILTSASINKLVKKNIVQRFFGGYGWTSEGQEMRKLLKIELQALEKELPLWMINDQRKALDVISAIKGNLFLLEKIDFQLLRNFDKEIKQVQKDLSEENVWGGYDYIAFDSSWVSDNHHSWDTGFDSSWDSVSSCSNSDSGCSSGCSGCGGGCGGD